MCYAPYCRYSAMACLIFMHAGAAYCQQTYNIVAGDTDGLIAAVESANTDGVASIIQLTASTYTFTAVDNSNYGPNALPLIESDLAIEGNGATLVRENGAPAFRFFAVSNGADLPSEAGSLTLRDVTLENGLAQGGNGGPGIGGGGGAGMGGAIFCRGGVALENVSFKGNTARGGEGGVDNGSGNGGGGGGMGGSGGSSGNGVSGGGGGGGMGGDGGSSGAGFAAGGGGGGIELDGSAASGTVGGIGGGAEGGDGVNDGDGQNGSPGGGGGGGGSSSNGGSGGFGGGGGGVGAAGTRGGNGGYGGGTGGGGGIEDKPQAGYGGGAGGVGFPGFGGGAAFFFVAGGGAGFGGALYFDGAQGRISNCAFESNTAAGGAGGGGALSGLGLGLGGAIFSRPETSSVSAVNLYFDGNVAADSSGELGNSQDAYGILSSPFRLNAGLLAYDIEQNTSAACLQLPVLLENTSGADMDILGLRYSVVVSETALTIVGGADTPMLIANAFAPAGSGSGTAGIRNPPVDLANASPLGDPSPSCPVLFNAAQVSPSNAIDFPAGTGAVWSVEDKSPTGYKRAETLLAAEPFGTLPAGGSILVGVLEIPVDDHVSPGEVRANFAFNNFDSMENFVVEAIPHSPAKGGEPANGSVAFGVGSAGNGLITLDFERPDCTNADIDVTDNVSGLSGTLAAPPRLQYRDPMVGGPGGSVTITVHHDATVQQVVFQADGNPIATVAATGTQTSHTFITAADGYPDITVERQLNVRLERQINGAGPFYSGSECINTIEWEPPSCEIIVSPGAQLESGDSASFDIVLKNAVFDAGAYGTLAGPAGASASLTVPGTALGNTLTFFNAFSIPSVTTANNGSHLVFVSGPGGNFSNCGATLSIDGPTDITLTGATVAENQPALTVVGAFSSTDANQALGHSYELIPGEGGDDNDKFILDGSVLRTNAPLDFEGKNPLSIRLRSTDDDGGTFIKVFAISVTDAPDAPTGVRLSHYGIADGRPAGTEVGVLSAIDQDGETDYTFALVAGEGDTGNGVFTIIGDRLQSTAEFDRAAQEFYKIRVRAERGADNAESPLVIYVTQPDVVYDNGYIVSGADDGAGGAPTSNDAETLYVGTPTSTAAGKRVADDFVVDGPLGATISEVEAYFVNFSAVTDSPIESFNFRIWDGDPSLPGSAIVFGDTTTDRLAETGWTGIYRTGAVPLETSFPVLYARAALGSVLYLAPGTYWLDYQPGYSSSLFAAPVTVSGPYPEGNALVSAGSDWTPIVTSPDADPESVIPLALAFRLLGSEAPVHSGDTTPDGIFSLTEVLRIVQFYNALRFGCETGTEDGYAPGDLDEGCTSHAADYNPQNWIIQLGELLRIIQLYNLGGYRYCPAVGEDEYCGAEG